MTLIAMIGSIGLSTQASASVDVETSMTREGSTTVTPIVIGDPPPRDPTTVDTLPPRPDPGPNPADEVAAPTTPSTTTPPRPTTPSTTTASRPTIPVSTAAPRPTIPSATAEPRPTIPSATADPQPTIPSATAEPRPTIPPVEAGPQPTLPSVTTVPTAWESGGDCGSDVCAELADTGGMSCQTVDCAIDYVSRCNGLGGRSATDEGPDGGFEMNCDFGAESESELLVAAPATPATPVGDTEMICEYSEDETTVICVEWEILSCEGEICDEEAAGPPKLPDDLEPWEICKVHPEACDPPENHAEPVVRQLVRLSPAASADPVRSAVESAFVAVRAQVAELVAFGSGSFTDGTPTAQEESNAGMSCQTLTCVVEFLNWCEDLGGSPSNGTEGDGWTMDCAWSDGGSSASTASSALSLAALSETPDVETCVSDFVFGTWLTLCGDDAQPARADHT